MSLGERAGLANREQATDGGVCVVGAREAVGAGGLSRSLTSATGYLTYL